MFHSGELPPSDEQDLTGTTLGNYRIERELGKGGIGVVYQAEDLKLKRRVALKMLSSDFIQDPQHLFRFQREAELLASLNHPNIGAIHGIEEADGRQFLVLELADGETIADKLKRGPIPTAEALRIGLQVAEGLRIAHEKGVIHRDLKPANVMISPLGTVKILDFGLGKFLESESRSAGLSASPTLPIGSATQAGLLLGTASYMSPEQARGKEVDARADTWAFGCLLFEALSGQKAFSGESITDILSAILLKEPDWEALPSTLPVVLRNLLHRCLAKDLKERIHDMASIRTELEKASNAPTETSPLTREAQPARTGVLRSVLPWSVTALMAILLIWQASSRVSWYAPSSTPANPVVSQFLTTVAAGYEPRWGPSLGLTPDGRHLFFLGNQGPQSTMIYHRAMDRLEVAPVRNTLGARRLSVSPDSQWLVFLAAGRLQRMSVSGGEPITILERGEVAGTGWLENGDLIVGSRAEGLQRITSTQRAPEPLTSLDESRGEVAHRWPEVLPGEKAVLFTISKGEDIRDSEIAVFSFKTGKIRTILEGGSYPRYTPSGHLLYGTAEALMAVPFELETFNTTGSPRPVLQGIPINTQGVVPYAFSRDGLMVYRPDWTIHHSLVKVDRKGHPQPLGNLKTAFGTPSLSPDGTSLAVAISEQHRTDIWIYDLSRGIFSPLTLDGKSFRPIWSADGKRVIFNGEKNNKRGLYWTPADGSQEPELIITGERFLAPDSVSSEGVLAYSGGPSGQSDIWTMNLSDASSGKPFMETPFSDRMPAFSADGEWIAYVSDRTGQNEVYAKPYKKEGAIIRISNEGGVNPIWSKNSKELFYREGANLLSVSFETTPVLRVGKPELLFSGEYLPYFDISPDGQFFYMVLPDDEESYSSELIFVLNWFEDLKAKAPTEN